MLNKIRNSKISRYLSVFLALEFTINLLPASALALTSGPSQPEVQSFEPIATTDMVDPFTGDFNYNVPLMQVGNYPINIFYHAGIGMDDEASCVGLGWNINPGNLTRNMRGLPDDFKGDEIITEQKIRPNNTYKVNVGLNAELLGLDLQQMENVSSENDNDASALNYSVYYNNYRGLGYSVGAHLQVGGFSTNLGFDNQSGFDVDLSLESCEKSSDGKGGSRLGVATGYNSRGGLSGLTLKLSLSRELAKKSTSEERNAKYSATKSKRYNSGFTASGGFGSSISFGTQTFTPTFTPWMRNTNVSLGVKLGSEAFASSYKPTIGVSFSSSYIPERFKKSIHKGLGYLYSGSKADLNDEILNDDNYTYFGVLMDFNRDRESDLNKNTRWLHTTNYTYDVYSASGQGVSGFFRPHRNSVGHVSDPTGKANSLSNTGVTVELAGGNLVEVGADVSIGTYSGKSESWLEQEGNGLLLSNLNFSDDISSSNPLDEPVYFKMAGEKSVNDNDFYNQIADDKAITIPLYDENELQNNFKADGSTYSIASKIKRNKRDKRSQAVTYLTADEAKMFGLERMPRYYDANGDVQYLNRVDATTGRKGHHLSEIIVTNPDGTRYVYGIAAYNLEQSEYTFSVTGDTDNPQNIPYTTTDRSLENNKGRDKYYKKQTTPPYAHTYLLTAVLSPDYVDIHGDGPSEDDYGTYTRINYTRQYTDFGWRTPFKENHAGYNRGMISEGGDDKGVIVYGKKEIWYVHSIESKTQVAKFVYSNRIDGVGVQNADGAKDNAKPLKKVDAITLYSKTDYNSSSNPLPIKTVHFVYNNSLCPNIPNTTSSTPGPGKLTLESFYFTYGNNAVGALNKYKFEYGKATVDNTVVEKNEGYTDKYTDRWGTYKGIQTSVDVDLRPWEHPYTDQDRSKADSYARMWNLTKITLPSGGVITPTYEADDYKYVQDKDAMKMVRVKGISDSPTILGGGDDEDYGQLYYTAGADFNQNMYLHLDLPAVNSDAEMDEMLKDIKQLYFSFKINLKKYIEPEIITGYAEIDDSNGPAYGRNGTSDVWVKVKLVTENGRDVNPFSVAAWQYMRNMRPDLAYPGSDTNIDGFEPLDVVYMIVGYAQELYGTIAGIRTKFMMQRNAQITHLKQSFVRLKCRATGDDAGKIGGGYRISAIDFKDNWHDMTGSEADASYGQTFTYKLEDGTTSGVASYEPNIGGDENACKLPLPMGTEGNTVVSTKTPLGPDDRFYSEGPIGEQFYPSPVVGYSRVIVRNKKPQSIENNLTRHGSGKIIHEFYTAKDFPVLTDYENIDTRFSDDQDNQNMFLFLGLITKNYGSASQGFSITTNDMHGKPRKTSVYAETTDPESISEDALISRIEYIYKQDGNKLVNDALTVNKDGSIETKSIGKEIEVVVDTKHKQDISISAGINLNLDAFMLGPIPIPVPTGFPDFNYTQNDIRYAICTKVVQRYGVLEATKVTQYGSSLTTKNILWDAETGEVLLTETQNEHNDNTYNMTLPSHWAYDAMGPAYKNSNAQGLMVLNCQVGSTTMELSDNSSIAHTLANEVFVPGDELMLIPTSGGQPVSTMLGVRAWVLDTIKGTGSEKISFIDRFGAPAINVTTSNDGEYTYYYKIIRSGRRNQQSLPVGSFISREKPLNTAGNSLSFDVNKAIINASAVEYSDEWQMFNGIEYAAVEYFSCTQKDVNSVPYFFNKILSTYALEGTTTDNISPLTTHLSNLISNYNGATSINMEITFSGDGNNLMTLNFTDPTDDEDELCSATMYLKALDASYEPFTPGGYFNNISNLTPGGYISASEKSYYDANTSGYYLLTAHTSNGDCVRFICYKLAEGGSCISFNENSCSSFNIISCNNVIDACIPTGVNTSDASKIINPYQQGVRGIWRPLRSYAYNSSRNYVGDYLAGTVNTNIRLDGTFKHFTPFWSLSTEPNKDWVPLSASSSLDKWVWTEEVTLVSPFGFDVENKDALNRYSSAVYGYYNSLPIITGGNARYCELAYDGFEDYEFSQILLLKNGCMPKDHFSFNDIVTAENLSSIAHTGSKSLKVSPTDNFVVTRYIQKHDVTSTPNSDFMVDYKIQPQDTLPLFSPRPNKYVISAWVKAPSDAAYANADLKVEVFDNTVSSTTPIMSYILNALTTQPEIEGWRRMEGTFTIDPLTANHDIVIKVTPENTNSSGDIYFDDIRIHPFNSMAKSFVYDPIRLRLIALLDENNYATFYEYDEEGNLIRTKKETERGIMTIQENRTNIKKQE